MIVPTARALILAATAAPLALLIAAVLPIAWIAAPAAGLVLIALIAVDALLAGRLADWRLHVPPDAEVGRETTIRLLANFATGRLAAPPEAALECDPRLADGGRIAFALDREPLPGTREGEAVLVPARRGPGTLSRLWLRWSGPMGLGARQVAHAIGETVAIRPDISPIRSPELQTFLRDAQFGLIARRIRGEGTQFEALAEYEPGMDRRRIDWKASARHTRLHARENEAERNNPIVFAFDCGQAMTEPVDGLARLDRAITAALTTAWVALKGGDRVALFGFARTPLLATPFVADTRRFHRLQRDAATLDYRAEEPNFTLALATLSARLQRRSLIVIFSDFHDPTGAELMVESVGRLIRRHRVLFVTLEDSELHDLSAAAPDDLDTLARSVAADTLAQQRALVLERLRRMGVDVLEAPWRVIGTRLIDRYLELKRGGALG